MIRTIKFLYLLLSVSPAWANDIPDLSKTPGVIRQGLSKEKICTIKWGKDERHVTAAMKRQVFELYGYSGYDDPQCIPAGKRTCEIDHLISRELGGADVVDNLWPQAYGSSPWNAVLKDKLENRLHKEICTIDPARFINEFFLVFDVYEIWKKKMPASSREKYCMNDASKSYVCTRKAWQ